eukprot:2928727-Pyramimonas_sp.AAC.1
MASIVDIHCGLRLVRCVGLCGYMRLEERWRGIQSGPRWPKDGPVHREEFGEVPQTGPGGSRRGLCEGLLSCAACLYRTIWLYGTL